MFFSKQSPSATTGELALQQDVSRPSSPVDVVVSPVSSLAISAATTAAPAPPAKSGLFSKWQRSSRTSSTLSVPVNGGPSISQLLKKNSVLLDQIDGLKQAEELNQLTKHKLADDLEAKEHECTQLRKSVRQLTTDLENSKQDNQVLTTSRDELTDNASTFGTQQASLQQEKNALATRISQAEDKVKKYELGTNALKQQVQSFTVLSTQQQQSSQDQVDAIYAQQLRTEQRTDEQLKAKDIVIRELQAQLKQSETAAAQAIVSREDKIAALSVQLERLALDHKTQAQFANEWQDCSNEHLARVGELKEQLKQFRGRFE